MIQSGKSHKYYWEVMWKILKFFFDLPWDSGKKFATHFGNLSFDVENIDVESCQWSQMNCD